MIDSGEMEYSRILNQVIMIGQITDGFMLCSYSSDDLATLFLLLALFPIYFVLCIMPVIVFSVVSLLTCLIPQHSLVLMFSFFFKESQEREARKVDVFDFGK